MLFGVAASDTMMMVAIAIDALAAVRGGAMLIGPGLFAATFAHFLAAPWFLPAAPWYLAAALLLAALVLAMTLRGRRHR